VGQDVFTPRLDQAGVNGIMRQFIIAQLAPSRFALSK
jgi:4-amino-4-deoxychorismate lyase